MNRRALVTVLVVLGAGGCGSGSLSGTQLRSQATRACQTADGQTDRIPTPTSPDGGVAFLKRGIAALAPELVRLRALRPPSDLAQVYSTAISASSDELRALRATVRGLEADGDPVIAIKTLEQKLAPMESQASGAWQALEVPACVNR